MEMCIRDSPKVVNFKRVQKQAQKQAKATGGYRHKCAVCGITDADDPNMEFRYCSKCDGYYCYCMNHINNHVPVSYTHLDVYKRQALLRSFHPLQDGDQLLPGDKALVHLIPGFIS